MMSHVKFLTEKVFLLRIIILSCTYTFKKFKRISRATLCTIASEKPKKQKRKRKVGYI